MRQNPNSQGPAHGCQEASVVLLCCTIAGISREADCELLFVAVGQFRDVAPFTEPSMPDPDPLFGSVGWKFLVRLCPKLALEWRSSMSLPCFFLWLEFKVTAGPGLRSLGSPPLPP